MTSNKPFISPITLGKVAFWLSVFVVIVVVIAVTLVLGFGVLSFGDRWWDITVPILIVATLIALTTALIAMIRNKDRSISVIISLSISLLTILFLLTHSLFISD